MTAKQRRRFKSKKTNDPVRPKKHLGQHFLIDEEIAAQIAESLSYTGYDHLLEIGPGTGMLTKYLIRQPVQLVAMDLDRESINYLENEFLEEHAALIHTGRGVRIIQADFLKCDVDTIFKNNPFAVIGNFPYNISSQILFKVLELREQIPEFAGMFQKEVAMRICADSGNKTYGIISILAQAFYETEYLFTVSPDVFSPPPKVESAVIRLKRRENFSLNCDEALFFRVVKTAFNQRRKTLRNSLKTFNLSQNLKEDAIFDRRPEELAVADFIALTEKIEHDTI